MIHESYNGSLLVSLKLSLLSLLAAPPGGRQRAVCWEHERDQRCRLHVLSSGPRGRAPWYLQVRLKVKVADQGHMVKVKVIKIICYMVYQIVKNYLYFCFVKHE